VGLVRIEEESIGNVCHGHMGPSHMPIALIGHLLVGLCLVVMGLLTHPIGFKLLCICAECFLHWPTLGFH
jgi:hypothetical protein